jgi:molecular chaperone HtpG
VIPVAGSRETHDFKADLRQVLDIITHSLYSHREIFLRELISNASDALDKLRFLALTEPSLHPEGEELRVRLAVDRPTRTLTVSDNGIGMDAAGIAEDLGTIARSGTKDFLRKLKEADSAERPELIGQFGVGFYSAFMVADQVTVRSRRAGTESGVAWSSRGDGTYTLEEIEKDVPGTEIVLHLREDADEFLDAARLRSLVKKYSDFIEHPIVMATEVEEDGKVRAEDEVLNSRKALWLRPAGEVDAEDYAAFYHQIARDTEDPLHTIHFNAEGTLEYKALLFVPSTPPWEQIFGEARSGLQLYIQRVFIMDRCEDLLPDYLRFMRGVVDSSDLPLNVSREMLQDDALVRRIRKSLTGKVLKSLAELKKDDRPRYETFFSRLGPVLKEGLARDPENRDRLADLLLFESTRTARGEWTTLEHYVAGMTEGQDAVWYLIGEERSQIEASPWLESLKEKGQEVLLLTDPVDEFLVHALGEYQGKPLRAVDREAPAGDEIPATVRESYEGLLGRLGRALSQVQEVRLSARLRESASCLVAAEGALGAHMERLLERMGKGDELPERRRILELNPEHPTVQALRRLHESDPDDGRVEDCGRLLYDEAVLAEGSRLEDPAGFARRLNRIVEESLQPKD